MGIIALMGIIIVIDIVLEYANLVCIVSYNCAGMITLLTDSRPIIIIENKYLFVEMSSYP